MTHTERRAKLETDARHLFHAAQAAPTAEAAARLDADLWDLAEQLYRMRHPAAQDRRMGNA